MALLPTYMRRPSAILKMPEAIARGLTVAGFIRELQEAGLSYRRTLMLGDWRSVAGIEAKKDVVKYIRKDRLPTIKAVADVEWELSKEYMYKVKAWSETKPGEPLTERFVNIMSDRLMTPAQIEQQVQERWGEWEKYEGERLKRVQVVGVYHRIEPEPGFELSEQ
jgi:hypothetical protein